LNDSFLDIGIDSKLPYLLHTGHLTVLEFEYKDAHQKHELHITEYKDAHQKHELDITKCLLAPV
jgi:hypothetical protein